MNLEDLFKEDLVLLNQTYESKNDALKDFAKVLKEKGYASSSQKAYNLMIKRENETSTGIGESIAIPHIRDEVMKKSVILFAKTKEIDWNSIDNQPVKYIFLIALNSNDGGSHVEILASLMKLFMNENFKKDLQKVRGKNQLISLINQYVEEEKVQEKNNENQSSQGSYDVVAVTACPTGIAHTFMARDMLEKAAQEMGIRIKVETQGADGTKNVLTSDDIHNAKGVIIACDRVVDLSKFAGCENVIEIGTKPVIKDAKKEIQKILDKQGHKFVGNKKAKESDDAQQEMSFNKFGKRAYKSLMTGVSYMLPFVIFGGILIAIAFLIDMPAAGTSNFGSTNPVAKWTKGLGDLAFGMMVPILGAYITYAIVGRQGLLPGFIVGLIAKGDFFFYLDPKTGAIEWLGKGGACSGVFGAIGGAFLAATILILMSKLFLLEVNTKNGKKPWFPASLNGIKNILLMPLFGTFFIAITFWIVNIPLIYLNWGFSEFLSLFEGKSYLAWLLGLILAAMMSVDLGGPINKAAYVFGTTSLATAGGAGTISMAAAMAGGMTAPLGIALSTTFFKKLWSKEDRESGAVNYIMGLTFISEGAIPLTLKNPKVMIPSNIIGSAVAGVLIGALGVEISAPHGGILTVALAKCNLFTSSQGLSIGMGVTFFIAAVIAGAVTSMFAIYLLSKIFNSKNNESSTNSKSKKTILKNFSKENKDVNSKLKIQNNLQLV